MSFQCVFWGRGCCTDSQVCVPGGDAPPPARCKLSGSCLSCEATVPLPRPQQEVEHRNNHSDSGQLPTSRVSSPLVTNTAPGLHWPRCSWGGGGVALHSLGATKGVRVPPHPSPSRSHTIPTSTQPRGNCWIPSLSPWAPWIRLPLPQGLELSPLRLKPPHHRDRGSAPSTRSPPLLPEAQGPCSSPSPRPRGVRAPPPEPSSPGDPGTGGVTPSWVPPSPRCALSLREESGGSLKPQHPGGSPARGSPQPGSSARPLDAVSFLLLRPRPRQRRRPFPLQLPVLCSPPRWSSWVLRGVESCPGSWWGSGLSLSRLPFSAKINTCTQSLR